VIPPGFDGQARPLARRASPFAHNRHLFAQPDMIPAMASFVIGVAGGSGSGKTTVVRRIVDSLGLEHVTLLQHDRYYRDRNDLRLEERAALNYDHPNSLETDLLVQHVQDLKGGKPVEVPGLRFHAARAASPSRKRFSRGAR
jgi:uridine kinase